MDKSEQLDLCFLWLFIIADHTQLSTIELAKMFQNHHRPFLSLSMTCQRVCYSMVRLVEQELHSFPEHLNSPPDFSGTRFAQSL